MDRSRDELAADARASLRDASEVLERTAAGYDKAIAGAGIADVLASLADQELRLRLGALAAAALVHQRVATSGRVSVSDDDAAARTAVRFEAYLRTGE